MKDEYIIINKKTIQKRIEEFQELWKAHSTYPNRTDLCINYAVKISLLKQIISQSTPLVTEIEKSQNEICDILLKPMEQLKPLEDLWRKENSRDKFVLPDTTQFFIWIREKILNANK